MPWGLTSPARLAPNADRKLFVAAYSTEKGPGSMAAADDVNTKQPRSFFASCMRSIDDIAQYL